ncbi:hypothetical protein KAR91_37135 [Candidatus Pacearchaeota archaeon]|nr:hypothetical protein [Candidatus Pacearchaeota archaeon]
MRNMSFALTTDQYIARTKTVTRRDAWRFLKPGDRFMGVKKAMGLKKGEQIVKFEAAIVLSVREEPLSAITQEDVIKEGFPGWSPQQFIDFLCKESRCTPKKTFNRIEFEYEDIYKKAVDLIKKDGHYSITLLQKELRISYIRSLLIINAIEREGEVTHAKTI